MLTIEPIASGSRGNCYYVSDGMTNILIEAGTYMKKLKEWCFSHKHGLRTIDACLVSHHHKDHAQIAQAIIDLGISTYMPKSAIESLSIKWAVPVKMYNVHSDYYKINNWNLYAFPLVHDVETVAYALDNGEERLYYITDTAYVPYMLNKVTHLMIECNFDEELLLDNVSTGEIDLAGAERIMRSHMSVEAVKGYINKMDKSRLKEIWLLHLSDRNADEARFRTEIQNLVECPVYIA